MDPNQPHEGDLAFAVSVATLYDLTIGRIGWDVRLTKHSHPTKATLTLANLTPGGPILNLVRYNPSTQTFESVILLDERGFQHGLVSGYIDWAYQAVAPGPPGGGTDKLRMYARDGGLYFKIEGSGEQQIPIGEAPGPGLRWSYWLGGG